MGGHSLSRPDPFVSGGASGDGNMAAKACFFATPLNDYMDMMALASRTVGTVTLTTQARGSQVQLQAPTACRFPNYKCGDFERANTWLNARKSTTAPSRSGRQNVMTVCTPMPQETNLISSTAQYSRRKRTLIVHTYKLASTCIFRSLLLVAGRRTARKNRRSPPPNNPP